MVEKKTSSNPLQNSTIPWLLVVVAAFVIGSMWSKLQAGKTSVTTKAENKQESPLSLNNLKAYAKELRLDGKKFEACLSGKNQADKVKKDADQGLRIGVSGTPAFFVNGYLISGAQPFANFKTVIDYLLVGGLLEAKTLPQEVDTLVKQGAVSSEKKTVDIGEAPVRGNPGAKITLVEFSDFECPFCHRAYPTVKQVLDTYKDTVRLVYMDFPLTQIHPNAEAAAEAASCAAEQGKFWEYHDKLFEAQGV